MKEQLREAIEKECLESYMRGAKDWKKSMIEGLDEALNKVPSISGKDLLDIIKQIDVS